MIKYSQAKPENKYRYSAAKPEQNRSLPPAPRTMLPIATPITSGPNQNIIPFQPPVVEKKPYSFLDSVAQQKPAREGQFKFGEQKAVVPQLLKDVATNQKNNFNKGTEEFQRAGDKSRELFQPLQDTVRKPFQGAYNSIEAGSKVPLKVLNTPEIQKGMQFASERTSGTGIVSMIEAAGPEETFRQAYDANRAAQAGDPSKLNQFLYQLGDTLPQTAFGVALNFVPIGGPALSTAYWTALSANEQVQSQGSVESLRPIVIDVLGDRMLGNSIQGLFKAPADTLRKSILQNFGVEGGTEVAQDLLKYQDAYLRADTDEKKAKILQDAKDYFTSGQILMTFGVGGVSGATVGTAGYTINQSKQKDQERHRSFLNSSDQQEAMFTPDFPTPPSDSNAVVPQGSQSDMTAELPSRFETAQELLKEIGKPRYGAQGLSVNRNEARQLVQYLVSLPKSTNKERGIVYKPYGAQGNEVDIILGDTGIDSGDSFYSSGKVVVEATKNSDGTYTMSNRLRTHGTPLSKDAVLDRLSDAKLIESTNRPTQKVTSNETSPTGGPGFSRMSRSLDKMVQDGTMLPEDTTILKTLFEGTDDRLLGTMDYSTNGRLTRSLGRFRQNAINGARTPGWGSIEMQKGLSNTGKGPASRVFTHEFGHAGYFLVLSKEERAISDGVYNSLGKGGTKALFQGGLANNPNYHAGSAQEFFAESFAEYVFSNKVPAAQMEPLLKKVARKFFDGLKRLVNRGNISALETMRPIYEKILAGDSSTPLSQFANQDSSSFKNELRELMNKGALPVPSTEKPTNVEPAQVPLDALFPSVTNQTPKRNPNAPDPTSPIEPVEVEPKEKVGEENRRTPNRLKVGLFNRLAQSPISVMNKLGLRENYIELKAANLAMEKEKEEVLKQIRGWMDSLPSFKDSSRRIFDHLDGEKVELTQEEAKVAAEIRTWLDSWADRLEIEPGDRITNYITHIFPKEDDQGIPEGIEAFIRNTIPGEVYNPFLLKRTGAEGYLKDVWTALEVYGKRAVRKVHMDPPLANLKEATTQFEDSQKHFIQDYVARINMRPTDVDKGIDINIKQVFGNLFGARPTRSITTFLRKLNSRSKIAGSAVTFAKNLTQGVNTFSELGSRYTVVGYYGLFKKGAGKELKDNGVLLDSFAQDQVYSAVRRFAETADKILYTNMRVSEFINRGAAYFGAKEKYLAGKVSPKNVKKALNKTVEKGYKPTEKDAVEYGKFVAETTQFTFGALDTPVNMQSDLMRTTFQYQTFTLKQMERIIGQVKNGEWDKFARYIFASSLLFAYIGKLFGMGLKDVFPYVTFGAPPVLSFFNDVFQEGIKGEDDWGNKLDTEERVKSVGKSIFTNVVPAGAQIKRGYEGVKAVDEGKVRTASGKVKYTIDQTPTNYARAALFGTYNLSETQEYHDKKDKKKDEKKKTSSSSAGKYGPAR